MLEFLAGAGDIHLVAIVPDGAITGRWFGTDVAGAEAWAITSNAAGANVYFTVNATHSGVTTKPAKSDITRVRYAHVDIDPPKHGTWDKDARLLELMAHRPTVVIDSGNGLQALWLLNEPCTPVEVESINRGIIIRLGADERVWNVDRLFRVPDTINYPDAKKRAMGRVPVAASLVATDPVWYAPSTLAAFYPAPAIDARASDEADVGDWVVYTPFAPSARLAALLEAHVPVGARSEHASAVAAQMGREGHTNEQIMGVMMNPLYPWQGTITDERQARRKVAIGASARPNPDMAFPTIPAPIGALPEPRALTIARAGGYTPRSGGVMLPEEQMEHFAGCVYVTSLDRVLMPNGARVNQSRFDATMGGHAFVTDQAGEKTSASAWEAFLKNQRFRAPTADDMCFRPELPSMMLVVDGNWQLVNGYIPIETPRVKGDATFFTTHIAKLFPDERDARIVLTYMASCIQNLGFKAQWWPVIQGAKGNGKTLLLNIMAYCVGEQYSHLPNTSKMTRNGINFNGWMRNKLFLGLDEVYSSNRRDFLEEFKPYITNRRLPIEAKGEEEFTGDNRANGIMLTNHKDGVPIDADERRYAPLFTAQQTAEDCARDGLNSAYFVDLWAHMRGEDAYAAMGADYGFRVINDFLQTYPCEPEFDPAQLATRAPRTSSTDAAIAEGRGNVEQEVLAAIDEGRPGFAGGWVSSHALDKLIDGMRARVPRNKRRDLMEGLGYHWHPGLIDGKSTIVCIPDGMRAKLYISRGHPFEANRDGSAITRAYNEAQASAGFT